MLIKSILSTESCVKVRVGMIVVVSAAYYHGFDDCAIVKIDDFDEEGDRYSDDIPYIDCSNQGLTQVIKPEHVRIASESEKALYRKQLKNFKRNANY